MAKPKPKELRKDRKVEFYTTTAEYEEALRLCETKGITISHIARQGFAWSMRLLKRDPNAGAPAEMMNQRPRPELKPYDPAPRLVRSREPF
jgi:hypothetical protein